MYNGPMIYFEFLFIPSTQNTLTRQHVFSTDFLRKVNRKAES